MAMSADLLNATRAKINWDQVLRIASSLRHQPCTVDGDEFRGGCNIVYRIIFEDGVRWALRVPYDESPSPLEETVTTMRYVRSAVPDIPIATIHGWSDSADGDGVGAPYMLLDWIEGKTLEWTADHPGAADREKVLAQLAQYTVELLVRTSTQASARSALAWTLRRIDVRLKRILTGNLRSSFDPIDCLIQRAMAEEKYHIPSLNAFSFPLMHTDLSKSNIVVDENYNIKGILDWDDWACRLPLQFAVICPTMFSVDTDPLDEALSRNDRVSFASHFSSAIGLSNLRDLNLPSILLDDELQIFQSSIGSKGVYALWVSRYSNRSAHCLKPAEKALDNFILAHPEMAAVPEVLSVRASLLAMQEEGLGH